MSTAAQKTVVASVPDNVEANGNARRVIMGIDSATVQLGWGVIEFIPSSRAVRYVDCGVVRMPEKMELAHRLAGISNELRTLIGGYKPTDAVVEQAFVSERVLVLNQRTAIALGEARGTVLCTAAQCGVQNITNYTPAQVKAVVTGSGASTKEQVAFWVRRSLIDGGLIGTVPFDATDALALALTHAILFGKQGVVVTARRRRRAAGRR